jgi:xylan 1,4-beta-xylosidase
MMSYWTFDDVFEEGGPKHEPFDGGFGIVAPGGIRKPGYYGYGLLHQLGSERLANDAPGVLVTRRGDGTLAVALWNMVDLDRIDVAQKGKGEPPRARQVVVKFSGVTGRHEVRVQRVDESHGNTLALYRAMGSPRYPTRAQVRELNQRSQPGAAQLEQTENGALRLEIPVNGLVLLELKP